MTTFTKLLFVEERVNREWLKRFSEATRCNDQWINSCSRLIENEYNRNTAARDGYSRIACFLHHQGEFEKALSWFEKDRAVDRAGWWQQLRYAVCCGAIGRIDQAIAEVERVYRAFPEAHNGYAMLGIQMKDGCLAQRDVQCNRLTPGFTLNVAVLQAQSGDLSQAVALVEQAYARDSTLRDGFARLGEVMMKCRHVSAAQVLYEHDALAHRLSASARSVHDMLQAALSPSARMYRYPDFPSEGNGRPSPFDLCYFNHALLKGKMGIPVKDNREFPNIALGYALPASTTSTMDYYTKDSNETVTCLDGHWMPIYGITDCNFYHFSTELLPRVFLAQKHNLDCRFIFPDGPVYEHVRKYIKLLKLPPDRYYLHRGGHLQVEHCYVPFRFYGFDLMRNQEYFRMFRESLLGLVSPTGPFDRRYYIVRDKAIRRHVLHEDALLALLHRFGFEPLELEPLSLAEQISRMAQCSAVVAAHGSGLTHVAFMPRNSLVIELFNPLYITHMTLTAGWNLAHRYFPVMVPSNPANYPIRIETRSEACALNVVPNLDFIEYILQNNLD